MFETVNDTTFKTTSEEVRQTIVGNSKEELFYPCVELQPWEDNDCLKIWKDVASSHSISCNLTADKDRLIWQDSKELWTISPFGVDKPGQISDYYNWSGAQFVIKITEKPKIDPDGFARFEFKMSGHEDMIFSVQPVLTIEEINDGCHRPDRCIDSISVDHKAKAWNSPGRTYKNGKVCHILRPWCFDSLGNFTWGKWEVECVGGTLTKCIPGKAFDGSALHWLIDATFGLTTQGGTEHTNINNDMVYAAGPHPAPASGTMTAIGWWAEFAAAQPVTAGFYNDDTGPNVRQGDSAGANEEGVDAAQHTQNLDSGVGITNGVNYWFAINSDWSSGKTLDVFYDSVGDFDFHRDGSTYSAGALPTPFASDGSDDDRKYSFWGVYTAAGGLSIAGTIAAVAALTGKVIATRSIKGTISATATPTGKVIKTSAFRGAISAVSSVAGKVVATRAMRGAISATATLTGKITTAGLVLLQGVISATSAVTGKITKTSAFRGTVSAVSSVTGKIIATRVIRGTISAVATVTGKLTTAGAAVVRRVGSILRLGVG